VYIADGLSRRKASCGCGAASCRITGSCDSDCGSRGRSPSTGATASTGDDGCDNGATRNGASSGYATRSTSPTARHGI
jgi:hypothetical protein